MLVITQYLSLFGICRLIDIVHKIVMPLLVPVLKFPVDGVIFSL